jgi:ATP-binding cassette subfamily C protein CydC
LPAALVRARIGWLGQSTHLFDDSIRENLLLARPDADDAALWAALDAARIGDVVRALLSPAPVLILDEPCAGLDAETERSFLETLNETASGRTVILITHRLTGVERLDRIFRLSGGKAVAAAG